MKKVNGICIIETGEDCPWCCGDLEHVKVKSMNPYRTDHTNAYIYKYRCKFCKKYVWLDSGDHFNFGSDGEDDEDE